MNKSEGTGAAHPGEQRLSEDLMTVFKYVKGWKREDFFGRIPKDTATEISRLQ